jgi:hypothetical protein
MSKLKITSPLFMVRQSEVLTMNNPAAYNVTKTKTLSA